MNPLQITPVPHTSAFLDHSLEFLIINLIRSGHAGLLLYIYIIKKTPQSLSSQLFPHLPEVAERQKTSVLPLKYCYENITVPFIFLVLYKHSVHHILYPYLSHTLPDQGTNNLLLSHVCGSSVVFYTAITSYKLFRNHRLTQTGLP